MSGTYRFSSHGLTLSNAAKYFGIRLDKDYVLRIMDARNVAIQINSKGVIIEDPFLIWSMSSDAIHSCLLEGPLDPHFSNFLERPDYSETKVFQGHFYIESYFGSQNYTTRGFDFTSSNWKDILEVTGCEDTLLQSVINQR